MGGTPALAGWGLAGPRDPRLPWKLALVVSLPVPASFPGRAESWRGCLGVGIPMEYGPELGDSVDGGPLLGGSAGGGPWLECSTGSGMWLGGSAGSGPWLEGSTRMDSESGPSRGNGLGKGSKN